MQLRSLPPITVVVSTHRTTISQLEQLLPISRELYADAAANTLISGPLFWIYHGMDGKHDTEFTLDIAIPIQNKFPSSKFSFKELSPFKAITHRHEGPWNQLPASYAEIFQFIEAHKIAINDELREIYLNVDFKNPANNITEIQMGAI